MAYSKDIAKNVSKTKNEVKMKSADRCQRCVPEKIMSFNEYFDDNDSLNKVTGRTSKVSLFLMEVTVILLLISFILQFCAYNLVHANRNVTLAIICTSVVFVFEIYNVFPIIYNFKNNYITAVQKRFVSTIIITILYYFIHLIITLLIFCKS